MPIFLQTLRESWRGILFWAVALVIVMTLYLSFYSSMGQTAGLDLFMAQLPEGMANAFGFQDIGSGAGWAQSTFFGLLGLFLLAAAGVVWGTRAIAGDEEAGMLELTLAHSVSRTQVYGERLLALVTQIALLGLAVAAALMLLDSPAELGLDFANVPPQMLAYLGVGFLCAVLAFAVGATTGRRSLAISFGGGLAVAAFLLNALGNVSEDNEWMHVVSPVSWAYQNRPLMNGWDLEGLALLYGVSLVLVVLGLVGFLRRDVTA
ncbi:MAG TPA: ABC transporter permease subunit [Actinomycetaceae bacterium]|nr:ABC transporter permease subunit [Actinomycetaceae bacterium]